MTTTAATIKNGSTDCYRRRYVPLGVDTTNTSHVYRTSDEMIFAIAADGTIEHRFDLLAIGKTADEYVEFVRERRGWQDQRYGFGVLLDQLEALI